MKNNIINIFYFTLLVNINIAFYFHKIIYKDKSTQNVKFNF